MHRSNGEYINYLHDDDIFAPEKIAKMMDYYLQNDKVAIVTSYRLFIDKNGAEIENSTIPRKTVQSDEWISKNDAIRGVLSYNFIGEPSTALVRKCDIDNNFGTFCGESFDSVNDVAQWLASLQHGDLIYIKDPLSSTRIHQEQKTNDAFIRFMFRTDFFRIYNLCYVYNIGYANYQEYINMLKFGIEEANKAILSLGKLEEKNIFFDIDSIIEFKELYLQAQEIVKLYEKNIIGEIKNE